MTTGAPPRIPVGCGAFVSFHPSLGSVVAKECGGQNALPSYFSMPRMSRSGGPNFLGAKHAPFVVLLRADMPSVLTEISFITNDREAALLATSAYRDLVADALFDGIARYRRSP